MAKSEFSMFPRVWTRTRTAAEEATCTGDVDTRFTLATYNVLTDVCTPNDEYLYCPEECRYMAGRHPRILTEIQTMNPDVICLQEVDDPHWEGHLLGDMTRLGYGGVNVIPSSKQGLAVFYKKSKFQLQEHQSWHVHDLADKYIQEAAIGSSLQEEIKKSIARPIVTLMVKLKHVTGDVISVANIHVSWEGLKYPAMQALQISSAVNELVRFAGGADKPHIICGDFNTPPDFPAYHMLTHSKMTPEAKSILANMTDLLDEKDRLPAKDIVELVPAAFCLHTDLKSAYKTVLGEEPAVTNCDDCGLPERTNLCLDYFWFSHQSLEVSAVLETPPAEVIMRHYALPSVLFPSDHLPIKAEFSVKH